MPHINLQKNLNYISPNKIVGDINLPVGTLFRTGNGFYHTVYPGSNIEEARHSFFTSYSVVSKPSLDYELSEWNIVTDFKVCGYMDEKCIYVSVINAHKAVPLVYKFTETDLPDLVPVINTNNFSVMDEQDHWLTKQANIENRILHFVRRVNAYYVFPGKFDDYNHLSKDQILAKINKKCEGSYRTVTEANIAEPHCLCNCNNSINIFNNVIGKSILRRRNFDFYIMEFSVWGKTFWSPYFFDHELAFEKDYIPQSNYICGDYDYYIH